MNKVSSSKQKPLIAVAPGSSAPAKKADAAPATAAATKPAPTLEQPAKGGPVALNAPAAVGRPAQPLVASSLHFDESFPDLRRFAESKGWTQPGQTVSITDADLVYTTDNWKTTKTSKLQYLYNYSRGFLLRDVPPGTKIEYAVHAHVQVSTDKYGGWQDRADVWFNNNTQNYSGTSIDAAGD